jgi:hypothetical protein
MTSLQMATIMAQGQNFNETISYLASSGTVIGASLLAAFILFLGAVAGRSFTQIGMRWVIAAILVFVGGIALALLTRH